MPAKEPAVPTDATLGYTFQNDFLALSRAFSLPDINRGAKTLAITG